MWMVALAAAAPAVVLVVRHAEKDAVPADDPPLTAVGRQRAAELVRVVRAWSAAGGPVHELFATAALVRCWWGVAADESEDRVGVIVLSNGAANPTSIGQRALDILSKWVPYLFWLTGLLADGAWGPFFHARASKAKPG